ncbi:MAG TPA: PRC and DUF2382 domain-containing protein [Pseudonocardia sp.]
MITQDQLQNVIGTTAYDRDGDKIGKIGQVYYEANTDEPKWVTVNTGLFGTHESFVPLQGAEVSGDRVTLAYDKAAIKDAPNISEDGNLSVEEEQRLFQHYGTSGGFDEARTGGFDEARTGGFDEARTGTYDETNAGTVGHDTSGPTTDRAMTRSEEQLNVGTETQEAGRARLRKHVVTENQQVTVPVSHEEVRIEREPITDANRGDAVDGPAISEEEHEVVLREERPVVNTEAVPVERVRLGTETVTEQETVRGEVRKEQIDVDDADTTRDRATRER